MAVIVLSDDVAWVGGSSILRFIADQYDRTRYIGFVSSKVRDDINESFDDGTKMLDLSSYNNADLTDFHEKVKSLVRDIDSGHIEICSDEVRAGARKNLTDIDNMLEAFGFGKRHKRSR